jgi:hypothetical protein
MDIGSGAACNTQNESHSLVCTHGEFHADRITLSEADVGTGQRSGGFWYPRLDRYWRGGLNICSGDIGTNIHFGGGGLNHDRH